MCSMSNIYVLCEHTRGKTVHPLYQSRITRHFIEPVFSPLLVSFIFHRYNGTDGLQLKWTFIKTFFKA